MRLATVVLSPSFFFIFVAQYFNRRDPVAVRLPIVIILLLLMVVFLYLFYNFHEWKWGKFSSPLDIYSGTSDSGLSKVQRQCNKLLYKGHFSRSQTYFPYSFLILQQREPLKEDQLNYYCSLFRGSTVITNLMGQTTCH